MSVFRIVFREDEESLRPSEVVEAVECVQHNAWIVFLDPSGPCHSVRSDDVERVERVQPTPLARRREPAPPPSYPPLPRMEVGRA
jgi:hypothetical protein